MADPWGMILAGQLVEGILAGYTNVMGAEIFYALIALIGFTLVYMRTQNIGTVAVTALVVSGLLFTLMPAGVQRLAYFLLVLGITIIIYKVFG